MDNNQIRRVIGKHLNSRGIGYLAYPKQKAVSVYTKVGSITSNQVFQSNLSEAMALIKSELGYQLTVEIDSVKNLENIFRNQRKKNKSVDFHNQDDKPLPNTTHGAVHNRADSFMSSIDEINSSYN